MTDQSSSRKLPMLLRLLISAVAFTYSIITLWEVTENNFLSVLEGYNSGVELDLIAPRFLILSFVVGISIYILVEFLRGKAWASHILLFLSFGTFVLFYLNMIASPFFTYTLAVYAAGLIASIFLVPATLGELMLLFQFLRKAKDPFSFM